MLINLNSLSKNLLMLIQTFLQECVCIHSCYVDSPRVYVNANSHMDSPQMSVDAINSCMDTLQDYSSNNKI